MVLISRCSRNIDLPDYDCKQKLFCSLRCEQIRCGIVSLVTLNRKKKQITLFRDSNRWSRIRKKINLNKIQNFLCEHLFSHEYNLCTHMSRLTHLCWPAKHLYVPPIFSLSPPKTHSAPHSIFSSFYVRNLPSNFVAKRFGWDDSGFLTDTLVCVEVHRQPSVVFLDNDLCGLLDSLRAYATL